MKTASRGAQTIEDFEEDGYDMLPDLKTALNACQKAIAEYQEAGKRYAHSRNENISMVPPSPLLSHVSPRQ